MSGAKVKFTEVVSLAEIDLECSTCSAKPDARCMTNSGKWRKPHAKRMTDGMLSLMEKGSNESE